MSSRRNSINSTTEQPVFAQPNFSELDDATKKALITQQHEQQQVKMRQEHEENMAKAGLLGKIIGADKDNAAVNVGAVALLVSFILLFVIIIICCFTEKEINQSLLTGIISIITLILGYLFGKKSD